MPPSDGMTEVGAWHGQHRWDDDCCRETLMLCCLVSEFKSYLTVKTRGHGSCDSVGGVFKFA